MAGVQSTAVLEADRERRALALFEAMLEIDPADREGWLDGQTSGDGDLHRRVEQLASSGDIGPFLTGGAVKSVEDIPAPERIGAYRLTGLIGAGGMGAVYSAERDRGDFDHQVAIKLIKPGLLSDRLAEGFARERQLLARISHPHIARLFDGGETAEGQPYFVMERIEGIALDKWLARTEPELAERLALFRQICDAVAYAHRHLIVHRDLTPANVLVDAEGQARLIDFGIARLMDEEPNVGRWARLRQATMTPGYAAPERQAGEAATTLSDVYSVGKLLEVLVGPAPGAELEAVIKRATASDPAQRYQTVDMLSQDVAAFANGFPVSALPAGPVYRLRKLVARHRPQTALIGALALAVVGGLAMAAWSWRQAETAWTLERQRFSEVRGIANFMLFDLYDQLAPVPGNTKALTNIAEESKAYLERLATGDDLSPDLRFEIAQGFHRLSNVLGNPEQSNLGQRAEARSALDRAIADLEELSGEFPARGEYSAALANALYSDAILKFVGEEDNAGAIASAERSAGLYAKLLETRQGTADHRFEWYRSQLQAAKPLVWLDRGDEGVRNLERLRSQVADFSRTHGENLRMARLLASIESETGVARMWHYPAESADYRKSLDHYARALAIYDRLSGTVSPSERRELRWSTLYVLFQRALALSDLERWDEAYGDLKRARELTSQLAIEDPDDEGAERRGEAIDSQLINVLLALGKTGEAATLAQELVSARAPRFSRYPDNAGYARDMAGARVAYADALKEDGQTAAACRVFRRAANDWAAIEKRWGLTSIDRENNLDYARDGLRGCDTIS